MFRIVTVSMLLAVALTPTAGLAQTQKGSKSDNFALLVGCSKYLKTEFNQLPFTGNDVMCFREALLKTGFRDENIVVLHDATKAPSRYLPQKPNILRELVLLLDGMREQDTLVVALSGHGLQFKDDPVSYFVPVDGKVEDKSTLIALSGKDGLYDRLKKCKAKQKLLIIDACRNDPVSDLYPWRRVQLTDEDRNEVPEGIAAIYSCQAGQKSYYDPDRKISLFFDHASRAWKGDYNRGGELTLEKFFDQVTVKTRMDATKTFGVVQTPSVQREYPGKWVIPSPNAPKAKETQGGGKSKNYAFLVGCSKYLKSEFVELPYSGNDVLGFREALLKTGFPDNNIVVMHDATEEPLRYLPQKANILHEFDLLLGGLSEQDTLVVALSGHGVQFKDDPVSYFVPVDGKAKDKSTLIAMSGKDGLFERLKQCKAKQKLLIVNACRNDLIVDVDFGMPGKRVLLVDEDRNEVPEGIAAIYSCQAGQKSYYDPDRKMSLFFDHVSRAWKGEHNRGGELTLEKFFDQVMVKTRMDAKKSLGVVQTPSVQRDYPGKWVIPPVIVAKPREKAP